MLRRLIVLTLWCFSCSIYAAELFVDNKPRVGLVSGELAPTDTLGGYAIFQGGLPWLVVKADFQLEIGSSTLPIGNVQLVSIQGDNLVAAHFIRANLEPRFNSDEWRGGPCDGKNLYERTGRNRTAGTCVFINPREAKISGRTILFLTVGVIQAGLRGDHFMSLLDLNTSMFGFEWVSPSDWTAENIAKDPRHKEFLARTTAWAERYAGAVERAFHNRNDGVLIMNEVPPISSLLNVPDDLREKGYSIDFLAAVAGMAEHQKYSAIAYSPVVDRGTPWGRTNNQASQSQADELAIEGCERKRLSSDPKCILVVTQ
ncbi:MAG: hypothetical protein RIQ60_541 [Pseudomonadota bacterium]|jgi:hypothetical protein